MKPLARSIAQAFGGSDPCPCSPDAAPTALPRRARKLWELPHAYHCALIGTCLPVPDMRRLAPHSGYDVGAMSDYSLHTVVVGYCASRCALTRAIQEHFDRVYTHALKRFQRAATRAEVMALWRAALAAGDDVPGALWAAWTHAAVDDDAGHEIHGDIHMLSHQSGAAVRADLKRLGGAQAEAATLRQDNATLRQALAAQQQAHDREREALRRDLVAAEQRAARLQRRELELAAAEAALARVLGVDDDADTGAAGDCAPACPAAASLGGRCVLCIGGRSGLVDGYRRWVERHGGRFLHRDGGQEESLHRLDAAVAAADAVVCQSACVSHSASWRLKEACKKLGKPCVFVQSTGVGSFARSLAALSGGGAGTTVIRLDA